MNHGLGFLLEFFIIQDFIAPTEVYIPQWGLDRYYKHSNFIPDLNNLGETKNPEYKTRLSSVKNFGVWLWEQDLVNHPNSTGWFTVVDKEGNEDNRANDEHAGDIGTRGKQKSEGGD